MQAHRESRMWQICNGDLELADGKTAFEGMRAGDETATEVVDAYLKDLAAGVIDVANIFRPEVILLGGGICKEGEALLKPLRNYLSQELFGGEEDVPVKLAAATLGNDAGICGAARLVM